MKIIYYLFEWGDNDFLANQFLNNYIKMNDHFNQVIIMILFFYNDWL